MTFSTKQFGPPIEATTASCGDGACDPICDADGCGDGTCNTLNGETPQSCIADCSGYSCTTSPDCDVLAFPDGCTGTWICSGAICVPQCE